MRRSGLLFAAIVLVALLFWGTAIAPRASAQNLGGLQAQIRRLESEVLQLRSQVNRLDSQASRVDRRSPASDRPVAPLELPDRPAAPPPTDGQFDRLATLVIELKQDLQSLDRRVTQLESAAP